MSNSTNVSIIIVNYNTKKLTNDCIQSIFKVTQDVKYEIVLVDNGSTDGSAEYFENYNGIIFIKSGKNLGFGKANNLGYEVSSGKYVFLLNSDTVLLNNAVKIFYETMECLPKNVACIGAPLVAADKKTITTSYGKFPEFKDIFKALFNLYIGKLLNKSIIEPGTQKVASPIDVDYITGADLFIRRNVIDECGLFCPDFFMYFEETELQLRYNKSRYKSQLVPGPEIIHLEPSLKERKKKRYTTIHRYIFFEGMFLYFKKRDSFLKYFVWRLLNLGYLPTTFSTMGTITQKMQLVLLFIGIKTIRR
ncbi:glycosyltransferase family 2 protein [Flavobacterium crocinum]|uniref:Glycosyltransferase family 2 protein n=1 Tax=Flavobacterium crocinum TaxID=2183896 RepID=A0A2S1YT06_9FLAO|nr:glycosyltransferase family 2 protein [Flavobacterium crocinum]AWK07244.1 glycosyltransferase family 2 protein [Flavobacterium crocinum]